MDIVGVIEDACFYNLLNFIAVILFWPVFLLSIHFYTQEYYFVYSFDLNVDKLSFIHVFSL